MLFKKGQWPIFATGLLAIVFFTIVFISRANYEFLAYIVVIILVLLVILLTNNKVNYPNFVLWGLVLWAIMHMAGGGLFINEKRLYELIIVPLVGEPYLIFKYDQLAHIIGFAVATMVMYYIVKPHLKEGHPWVALTIVVLFAGVGLGALNEMIEFSATVIVKNTGVGGYINTSLDLISNLIGAGLAMLYLYHKEK